MNVTTRIERKAIADLNPAGYNPRKISREARTGLRKSIARFGLVQPIIWNRRSGLVVSGHQRLSILAEQGIAETDVVVVDLDDRDERALNLAMNNAALTGEFTAAFREITAELAELDPALYSDLRLDVLDATGRRKAGFDDADAAAKLGAYQYQVLVECADERDQARILVLLRDAGITAKGQVI